MELHANPTERKFCHGHFCEGPWGPSAGLLWSSRGQGVANPTRAVSFPCYERQAPFLLVSSRETGAKPEHTHEKVCPAYQQVSWHFFTFLVTVTYWPPTISGSYLKPRKITNSQTCQPLVFRSHYSGQKHDEICIRMRNFCEYVSCCLVLSFVSLPATIPPLYFLASRTVKPIWFQNVCKFIIAIKEKEFHIELFFWDVCCCSLIMKESRSLRIPEEKDTTCARFSWHLKVHAMRSTYLKGHMCLPQNPTCFTSLLGCCYLPCICYPKHTFWKWQINYIWKTTHWLENCHSSWTLAWLMIIKGMIKYLFPPCLFHMMLFFWWFYVVSSLHPLSASFPSQR